MSLTASRTAVVQLLLLFVTLSPTRAADPALVARWPAKASDREQVFEGGQFVTLSPAPIVGNGPFTVAVWVNANDLVGGNATYGRGIARSTRGEQVGDWLLSVHPDGRVRFCNWRKTGDDAQGSHVTQQSLIVADSWNHLVATWDGKTNHLFVNGVETASDKGATAAGWGTGHEVGRCWTEPSYAWDGLLDDLRVSRRALAPSEVGLAYKSNPHKSLRSSVVPSAGDPKVSQALDRILLARLQQHKLSPAPAADDTEFLRRVTLDLAGRIPTTVESEAFLADKSAEKRSRLIDSLLAGAEMPIAWAQVLSGWLMPKEGRRDPQFVGYLRKGLAKNKSWDRFTREMLVARPSGPSDQFASSFLSYRKAALADQSIARDVGRAFFGVNLRCAQCHDHPHVKEWTRERFYGLSAFFARSYEHPYLDPQNQNQLAFGEKDFGELEYVATGGKKTIARLMFLDGKVIAEPAESKKGQEAPLLLNSPPPGPSFSRREALARVALTPKSPFFKRAIVNRVWQRLMGRALVEPVDMMHDGNPATHPALLDLLADDFADHRFDLRRLLAVIVKSEAYARASRWPGKGSLPNETLYAVALLKPLDADQLALSLPLTTGYYDQPLNGGSKRTLAQLRSVAPWQEVVAEFDSESDTFEPTAAQALFLTNSNYVQTHFITNSNLVKSLSVLAEDAAVARKAYLSVLSRLPSVEETARVSRYLRDRGPKLRGEACRELVWALLSSAEFRFNH
jgi:hypothetical protein